MLKKYSKPSSDILSQKQAFFSNNDALRAEMERINKVYAEQPRRTQCKMCEATLGDADFTSFGVSYVICDRCGHLNGLHEDTAAFTDFLYRDEKGGNYAKNYLDGYDGRVNAIYIPKVDFLLEVMGDAKESRLSVADIGCGGGHFVKACEIRGIAARGYDPNATLIGLGSQKLEKNAIEEVPLDRFETVIEGTDANVVCLIGVLEHLREPLRALAAFTRSRARFLYLSVPVFSFSVFLEHGLPAIFPRQLAGGHTHLYTRESLDHLMGRYGLRSRAEWWFGTDMVDLYRSLAVTLNKTGGSDKVQGRLSSAFGKLIDDLQAVFDRHEVCSEVHLVLEKAA
jgi:SAM-dependent methyltransferase